MDDQATYDEIRFLAHLDSAYQDAIVQARIAIGRLESVPGAKDGSHPLKRAIKQIEQLRRPVSDALAEKRAYVEAQQPKLEGFRSL